MPTVRGESKLPMNKGDRCPRMVAIVVRNCCPRMAAIVGRWSGTGTKSEYMVILSFETRYGTHTYDKHEPPYPFWLKYICW